VISVSGVFAVSVLMSMQPAAPAPSAIDRAFVRLYNLDFPGAFAILDENARTDPGNPLNYSVRAGAYLFKEMQRLRILETDFFLDNDNLVDGTAHLEPDPDTRKRLYDALAEARRRADARLAVAPRDVDALFAICMVVGVDLDYVALVERRTWRSLRLARDAGKSAAVLLTFDPPFYDAYLTFGSMEYIVGSLPFFIRWFVHYDGIQGNKRQGIDQLKLAARQGRYYGPFARILLTLVSLREKKPEEAQKLLTELARDFPDNPVFKKELARVSADLRRRAVR
jgi:hypothetical protein